MIKLITLSFCLVSIVLCGQVEKNILDISEHPGTYTLSSQINETSALEFYKDFLYTCNDSGGDAEIYKLSSENGKIVQTLKIKGVKNVDWEELARKGDTLFIGDFGNNLGIRKDLTVYWVVLPIFASQSGELALSGKFQFTFEDQKEYENLGNFKTNFDCEAFIYYKNKLHLFTKRWGDFHTTHYELDLESYSKPKIAKKIETFNTECLITGADIYNDILYLIGYTKEAAYVWKFYDFNDHKFFNGKSKQTLIGLTASLGQTEAIAVTDSKIYITGEEMNYSLFHVKPTLYILNKEDL
jgi:hypothetical protein